MAADAKCYMLAGTDEDGMLIHRVVVHSCPQEEIVYTFLKFMQRHLDGNVKAYEMASCAECGRGHADLKQVYFEATPAQVVDPVN